MSDAISLPPQEAALQYLEAAGVTAETIGRHLRVAADDYPALRADSHLMLPMTLARLALLLYVHSDRTDNPDFARTVSDLLLYSGLTVAIHETAKRAEIGDDRRAALVAEMKLVLLGPDYLDRQRPL